MLVCLARGKCIGSPKRCSSFIINDQICIILHYQRRCIVWFCSTAPLGCHGLVIQNQIAIILHHSLYRTLKVKYLNSKHGQIIQLKAITQKNYVHFGIWYPNQAKSSRLIGFVNKTIFLTFLIAVSNP